MGEIEIKEGYVPGLIGTVSRLFSRHFADLCGFGQAFEIKVACELADFVERSKDPDLAFWHASLDGEAVGSVFIDGKNLGDNIGHLRWFILDPKAHGNGIGNALMTKAMGFCDARGFEETHLWTIKGTDAARRLYEHHGFELEQEFEGDQWGSVAVEQKFIRKKP